MLTSVQAIGLGAVALVASYIGVSLFAGWAERAKILDVVNPRSSHQRPTPRGAGLVIVVLTLAGAWSVLAILRLDRQSYPLLTFTVGSLLIAGVSWCDDVFGVPAGLRLIIHGLAAIVAIWGVGYWHTIALPLTGDLALGWAAVPLTFLWIVGLTNAFNFIDGIDGLAGSLAVVAALGWLAVGWISSEPLLTTLGILIAAGSLGFLLHNWSPARVFMGDVGSAFLGYSFALLPFFLRSAPSWAAGTAMLLVWPIVFDSGATFLWRLACGENVFAAHRMHFYQRLVAAGHGHASVASFYAGLAMVGTVLALAWTHQIPAVALTTSVGLPVMCALLWRVVRQQEQQLKGTS